MLNRLESLLIVEHIILIIYHAEFAIAALTICLGMEIALKVFKHVADGFSSKIYKARDLCDTFP